MPASHYGAATLRARLFVIAQSAEMFEELGPVAPPIVPHIDPKPLSLCLEPVGDMLPNLDVAGVDSDKFEFDEAPDRGPHQQRRVGWFRRDPSSPRVAVWSIHYPAFTVRAYGAGKWEGGDFSLDAGPGSCFYLDDRRSPHKVFALSHVACAAIQGVPFELFGGAAVDQHVKRCYEAAGNAVPWELARAMASCTQVRVSEMVAREQLYLAGGVRRVLCLCFVAWRRVSAPPVRQDLRAAGGDQQRVGRDVEGSSGPRAGWDTRVADRGEPAEGYEAMVGRRLVNRAARDLRARGVTVLDQPGGRGPDDPEPPGDVPESGRAVSGAARRFGGQGRRKEVPTPAVSAGIASHAKEIMELAWAEQTRKRYAGYWKHWEDFMKVTNPGGGAILRAANEEAEGFLVKFLLCEIMYHENSWGTASNKLTAVRSYHLKHYNVDLSKGLHRLEALSRSLGKEGARTKVKKRPVRLSMLREIRAGLSLDFFESALAWAAVALAFFGMLRVGQYAGPCRQRTLRDADIQIMCADRIVPWESCTDAELNDARELMLVLRDAKNDQSGEGGIRFLGLTGNSECPVAAVCAFVRRRRDMGMAYQGEQPFLRRPVGSKKAAVFSEKEVTELLKSAAGRAGQQPVDYGTHSLRTGGASALHAAGVSVDVVKKLGDWKSNCVLGYMWESRPAARDATRKMATAADASDQEVLTLMRARREVHRGEGSALRRVLEAGVHGRVGLGGS